MHTIQKLSVLINVLLEQNMEFSDVNERDGEQTSCKKEESSHEREAQQTTDGRVTVEVVDKGVTDEGYADEGGYADNNLPTFVAVPGHKKQRVVLNEKENVYRSIVRGDQRN